MIVLNKTHRFSAAILVVLMALLTGCGATTTPTASPAASTAASASPAASASAAASASPSAAGSASAAASASPSEAATESAAATPASEATPSTDTTAAATTGDDATPAIVAAANAFLATLDETQKEAVLFDWTDTEQKQRWSNLPEGLFERDGLMWGDLSEAQQNAWLAVMQATLSEEGYNRVIAEWNADDQLTTGNGGGGGPGGGQLQYGKQYYWVALIGTPSESDPWQWQWGGHHVTVNATIADSTASLSPSFIGCQPCEYTDASGATIRPLGDIEDEAFALVNSLDDTQKQAAVLGSESIDLVLGPGQDGKTIQSEGLPASQMTADQQGALLKLISHYTGLVNDEDAAARTAEIESGLNETYFVWYGSTTQGEAGYFRITGPTIVIEYSPQQMGGNAANHIHGIYRDPSNEYGAKYTQ